MPRSSCKELIKDYCTNCSFAGIHFIADDSRHWTERWYWVVLVALSWYGSAVLIASAWDDFRHSSISFGVDSSYIHWDTNFPSVGVCETTNLPKLYEASDSLWTPDHSVDLEEVLMELVYYRGRILYTLQVCHHSGADPLCPTNNFDYYANFVRSSCHESISNCSYNGVKFDCCEYFQPVETDVGRCYLLNSIQTEKPKKFPMVNNKKNRLGHFRMEVLIPAKVYTLDEEEVPAVTTLQSSTFIVDNDAKYRRHVAVRNIENDPLAVETTPEQRACRYLGENAGGVYPQYSYSACTILCRKRAQLDLCDCHDHFMPGESKAYQCNISGLACLSAYYPELSVVRPQWARRPGLPCDCLPSCTETEITVIKDERIAYSRKSTKSEIEIVLQYLPSERFKRNVIRSKMDLVVSVGGTTGLFLGASLLSFVELIFYFTIRFWNNYWMEKERGNTKKYENHSTTEFRPRNPETTYNGYID